MATQNSGFTNSHPSARARRAAQSGVVANSSVTVDAVVFSSAYINAYWLIPMPIAPPIRNIGMSLRLTRSEPSRQST